MGSTWRTCARRSSPASAAPKRREVIDGRRRYPVVVRLDAPYRSTPEAIGQTLIRTPAGGTVTLSQVARLRTVEGPEVIEHEGGQRYVVVQSNVRGRDLGGFVADVRRAVGGRRDAAVRATSRRMAGSSRTRRARRAGSRLIVPLVLLLIAGCCTRASATVGTRCS